MSLLPTSPSCRIFPSDAALTFANYGDYDVIFFYRPLRSEPLQEQMEERIYAAARERCILLPMYPICEPPAAHFTCSAGYFPAIVCKDARRDAEPAIDG